jgi:hypothetical protein
MANLKIKLAAAMTRANNGDKKLVKSSSTTRESKANLANPFVKNNGLSSNLNSIKRAGTSPIPSYSNSASSSSTSNQSATPSKQNILKDKRTSLKNEIKSTASDLKQKNKIQKIENKFANKGATRAAKGQKKIDRIAGTRDRAITAGKVGAATGAVAGLLTLAEQAREAFKRKTE